MRDFCKSVNAGTSQYIAGVPIQLTLTAYSDNSYDFVTKSPQTSWFIKRCAGIEKCRYLLRFLFIIVPNLAIRLLEKLH